MNPFLLLFSGLVFLHSSVIFSQENNNQWIETEAKIIELDFSVKGRRSAATATVVYKTNQGDSLKSKVKIFHIPFIGPLKDSGDMVTVYYDENQPLILTTKTSSLWQKYGLYILILIGILYFIIRFVKKKS